MTKIIGLVLFGFAIVLTGYIIGYLVGRKDGRAEWANDLPDREDDDTFFEHDAPFTLIRNMEVREDGEAPESPAITATGWLGAMAHSMEGATLTNAPNRSDGSSFTVSARASDETEYERNLRPEDTDWALMAAWDTRIWGQEEQQSVAHWGAELDSWAFLGDWDGIPAELPIPDWAK